MDNAGKGGRRGDRDARRGRPARLSVDEQLSRFLAFVLRHHPEEIGLALDEQGAADIDELLLRIRTRPGFASVTHEQIEQLAAGPSAVRFEVRGNRLRARYGHSLPQLIQYEPATPPADLFHGSTPEAAEQILAEGLKVVQRQRVHLSVDTPAAREVGRRRCPDPVVLRIDTACAAKAGIRFYHAGPAVWLSDDIPPECLSRVE
jgi:putative RNA 2'-phosphotransferase